MSQAKPTVPAGRDADPAWSAAEPPDSLPLPSQLPSGPIAGIDSRLVEGSLSEADRWVRIRGQIMEQEQLQKDREHHRAMEKLGRYATVGLTLGAFGAGVGLVLTGFALPGFVCIGAGLYGLAPKFIDRVADNVLGKKP